VAREALTRVAAADAARAEADFLLAFKEADFSEALVRAAGVVVDPLADQETLVPGAALAVTARLFAPAATAVKVIETRISAPRGWEVKPASEAPPDVNPFARFFSDSPTHTARFAVTVPADAPLTQPYYLEDPRDGDRYRWHDHDPRTLPFAPPLLAAAMTVEIGGVRLDVTRPVQYRTADRIRGELRRDVNVVPPVSVSLDTRLLIVPTGAAANQQRLIVRAINHLPSAIAGTVRLAMPPGWSVSPPSAAFSAKNRGDRISAAFTVTAPAGRTTGAVDIVAEAVVNGSAHAREMQEIAYPHIQTHRVYSPARATARVLDLRIAPVRVGYVMGSGDQVADMIRRMGVPVTLVDDPTLASGDLSAFDVIVVGIRASEARPAFVANHARLLDYVERGGTLIVQYQQNDYVVRGLPPYPAQMNSRVVDETAPVRVLAPSHAVFTFPNRIGPRDFDGWVQERNLYAFTTFDERYVPLLESADAGEPPQRGGEVYARIGKGHYVYTAYAWFRQLPAGVPGAYRLFANLLSLPKAPRSQP
jgi:hypothetical protein